MVRVNAANGEEFSMVLRRIGPLSCAKIAGTLYAAIGLVFGIIVALISMAGGFSSSASSAVGFGLVGVGAIVALPLLYGCLGFVATLIGAWLYNVVAGAVGGIELDLQ